MKALAREYLTPPDEIGVTQEAPTLDAMLERANVRTAWERVRRNQGCAGIDGVTIAELEPRFEQEWLPVERALRQAQYQPKPLLRVRVPKACGGERLLGIPAVMDRVVHQAAAQVLAPCWEPRFSDRSYGYRPGRSPRGALAAVERALNAGATHVLHVDIADFFDSVPHAVALTALAPGVADPRLVGLVQATLTCGVYEQGVVRHSTQGLAQGSPLSPLLANVVLHALDLRLEAAGWEFARYADDCVVLLAGEGLAVEVRATVVHALTPLGLRLNERKTAFTPFEAARFLGFAFRRGPEGRVFRTVSPESLAEITDTLLQSVATDGGSAEVVAADAARLLQSWLAYFYTPPDRPLLQALVARVVAGWRERFPGRPSPACLCWDALVETGSPGEHLEYSGHLRKAGAAGGPVDWTETVRWLLRRLMRSHWWHVEYDLRWGVRPALRLCVGRHRLNFRL